MDYRVVALLALVAGCSGADGSWPSLMTPAERAAATAAAKGGRPAEDQTRVAPVDPAFASLPVIGAAQAAEPAGSTPPPAVAALVSRLGQERRAQQFALSRLADQRAAVAAANALAAGQPAKSAAGRTAAAEALRLKGYLADLADQPDGVLDVLAALAQLPASQARSQAIVEAGRLLLQLDAARLQQGLAATPANAGRAVTGFSAAQAQWARQAQALRASLALVRARTPEDAAWNTAQIELTRIGQTAKQFSAAEDVLMVEAAVLARTAAGGADVTTAFDALGLQLGAVAQAQEANATLVQDARQKLEGS